MSDFMQKDYQNAVLQEFTCLGDACEDTCCKSWSMQLDPPHLELYKKEQPDLLDAVTEDATGPIMRRDDKTDYCVKYDNGWCGIHKAHGTRFLGDACHFYPRVTRDIGQSRVMTATMSCPEIARMALLNDIALHEYSATTFERVPNTIRSYTRDSLSAEQMMATHTAFIQAIANEAHTPEQAMAALYSVSLSLRNLNEASWPEAVPFYMKTADSRLRPPKPHNADAYRLLHALVGLISAAAPVARPRLDETVATMENALDVDIDRTALTITMRNEAAPTYPALYARWQAAQTPHMQSILRRWIQMQISTTLFPFAGLGEDCEARALLLSVRFATVRLALMCHMQGNALPDDDTTIRVIQSISRFMDHLADPTLSLDIYKEVGWLEEDRLMGLLQDEALTEA